MLKLRKLTEVIMLKTVTFHHAREWSVVCRKAQLSGHFYFSYIKMITQKKCAGGKDGLI
jgi:hypothetical protein